MEWTRLYCTNYWIGIPEYRIGLLDYWNEIVNGIVDYSLSKFSCLEIEKFIL